MKKEIDIYNFPAQLESALNMLRTARISQANKKVILAFRDFCSLENMSIGRIIRYIHVLKHWAVILDKDFESASKEDIMGAVRIVQEKGDYTPWTKVTYKIMLKRFYRWLRKSEGVPEEVKWIKTRLKRNEIEMLSSSELITEEEVKKLISFAENPRDRALVACLYESGSRIGELASMQIVNVKFDEYGTVLNITGKTGPRLVRVIFSTSYLASWINFHPFRDDPKAPLWVKNGPKEKRKALTYSAIRKRLYELFKKAGIKKGCNPHLFRHSRATFMADHLTEFQMNQYFGWTQGSRMPSTYVHMSGKNLDSSILALNGIATPQVNKESELKPKICPRCNTLNSSDAKFCNSCARILDTKTAIEVEMATLKQKEMQKNTNKVLFLLMKDKDFLEVFTNKVKELGSTEKLFN